MTMIILFPCNFHCLQRTCTSNADCASVGNSVCTTERVRPDREAMETLANACFPDRPERQRPGGDRPERPDDDEDDNDRQSRCSVPPEYCVVSNDRTFWVVAFKLRILWVNFCKKLYMKIKKHYMTVGYR